jgi:hypothetical protein
MAKSKLSSQQSSQKKPKAPRTAASADATVRLPASWTVAARACSTVWNNRWLFLGIASIYILFYVFLVRGLHASADLMQLKQLLYGIDTLSSNVALLAFLITSPGERTNDGTTAYLIILAVITSLAIVWALRQVMSGAKVRIRDSFYKGMYPLVPVLLVLLVIALQSLPFIISAALYDLVIKNGIAVSVLERVLWSLMMVAGAAVSLYFLSSSVMALYIAALPEMTPVKALRSARELVRGRRLPVLRKLLFLPAVAVILAGIIMLSVIALWTPGAPWALFGLSMAGIVLAHAYLYTLYRELLV